MTLNKYVNERMKKEAYSKPYQTSNMDHVPKINNDEKPGSKYAYETNITSSFGSQQK